MSEPHVLEGRWEEILSHNAAQLAGRYVRVYIEPEKEEEPAESLEAAIQRMTSRTPAEIASVRERILAATPPPRELPEGKTIFDVVMGQWPGNETDEEIHIALEKLS
jgi:hypothetical protein